MKYFLDEIFDEFFDPFFGRKLLRNRDFALSKYRRPSADIWETDKEIIAEIEMPGVSKKDIKLNVNEDSVEIKAKTKSEIKQEDKEKGLYRCERSYKGYYRCFSLPKAVLPDKAEAEYKRGILKIIMPKAKIEEKKEKLVEVK